MICVDVLCIMRYMLQAPIIRGGDLDDLFQEAVKVVAQYDKASSSLLQRRLAIGYARAARLMDQLEASGVVSQSDGSSVRKVLVSSYEGFLEKGGNKYENQENDTFKVSANYKVPTNLKLSQVQNTTKKQLTDVTKSSELKSKAKDYPITLGYDDKGKLLVTTLPELGNLIITGNPQSTKQNWLDSVLLGFLLNLSPKELRVIPIDSTRYLDLYDGIPHLLCPVISDFEKRISALRWATYEMNRRMNLLAKAGTRSIDSYNKLADVEALPRVLIIYYSEWEDVESMTSLTSIASSGLRAGINLFIIVNRMSEKNISADVKANIPNRAVFTVTSTQDSTLAGVKGAESLQEGEALFRIGNRESVRLSTVYAPEINIKEIVQAVTAAGVK